MDLSQQMRQAQVLSPQMRQSLDILQLPALELRGLIQAEMERNPVIEHVTQPGEISLEGAQPPSEPQPAAEDQVDALLRADDEWRDYFLQDLEHTPPPEEAQERRQWLLDSVRQEESLQDHLMEQVLLLEASPREREILTALVGNVDDDGYFRGSFPDLQMNLGSDLPPLEHGLAVLQGFDPPGVGARSLAECLRLQVLANGGDALLLDLIDHHLEEIAGHGWKKLAAKLGVPEEELQEALAHLRALDPAPGRLFGGPDTAAYVTPEIFVRRAASGAYAAEVDGRELPRIRISRHYRKLLEDPHTAPETRAYIRDRIRAGAALISGIRDRQTTLKAIAQTVIDAQHDFLERGPAFLHPLRMVDVAGKVGLHPATVSRAVAGKYMQTPRGVFELRSFFAQGVGASGDAEALSNTALQERIRLMIAREDPAHPLSDQAIEERLKAAGLEVARRTIAKYRGILKIPSTRERRKQP